MSKVRSLGNQTTILTAGTALSQALTAVLYILTARASPVEVFGLAAASIAAGMVLAALLDFGLNSLLTRELASGKVGLAEFWVRAKVKSLIGLGIAALWFFYGLQFGRFQVFSSVIFISLLIFQTSLVPLRSAGKSAAITSLLILERAVAACVFFFLVAIESEAILALVVSLFTGTGVASMASIMLSRKKEMSAKVSRSNLWPWRGTSGYGLSATANALQQLDVPLLTLFAGPAASGIYASVSKWTQPLGIVANAFSTAATPFIAKADGIRTAIREVSKAAWLIVLACLCSALIALLSPLIVELLLGNTYLNSIPVLQLLAIGTIPAIINQVLAVGLQARGFDRQVAMTNISGVATQIGIIMLLASSGGAIAAAIAYCVLQVGVLLTLSIFLGKKLRLELRT